MEILHHVASRVLEIVKTFQRGEEPPPLSPSPRPAKLQHRCAPPPFVILAVGLILVL